MMSSHCSLLILFSKKYKKIWGIDINQTDWKYNLSVNQKSWSLIVTSGIINSFAKIFSDSHKGATSDWILNNMLYRNFQWNLCSPWSWFQHGEIKHCRNHAIQNNLMLSQLSLTTLQSLQMGLINRLQMLRYQITR